MQDNAAFALGRACARRPLVCAALGLIFGLLLGRGGFWVELWPWLAWTASLGALGALVALIHTAPSRAGLWLLGAGLALGILRIQPLAVALQASDTRPIAAAEIRGVVHEDLGTNPESQRQGLILRQAWVRDLSVANDPWRAWPGRLRVSVGMSQVSEALGPEDQALIYASLRPHPHKTNPGEFDYRAWCLGRGITGLASGREGMPPRVQRYARQLWPPRRLGWELHRALDRGLTAQLSPRALALARGIVLGDKAGLSRQDLATYARGGLADLLAVSGTHLVLATGIFLLLARIFTWRGRAQAALALSLALLYALATGWDLTVQRALALFGLGLLGRILDLETDFGVSLAAGALAVLLAQPGALFEASFQLSALIALSAAMVGPPLAAGLPVRWPAWLRQGLGVLMAAQLALLPLLAWHFHMVSWPGLIATVLAAPLAPVVLGLGLLCGGVGWTAPSIGAVVAWPLERALGLLDQLSVTAAALPASGFATGTPSMRLMLCALALGFLIWGPSFRFKRSLLSAIAAGLLLWMLWPGLPWSHRHPGQTRAWILDVGQGDAVVVQFADGKTLLVDAGGAQPDMGSWVVVPALRSLGIWRLDWAVVTHPHADHVGGMAWVLDQIPTRAFVYSARGSTDRARKLEPPVTTAARRFSPWLLSAQAWSKALLAAQTSGAQSIDLGLQDPPLDWQEKIEVLGPPRPPVRGTKHDMHNNGVVLSIEGWFLLPGDLERDGEARLVRQGLAPHAVLKAGHHGSKTSSSAAWLKALDPKWVLMSCGRANRYRHPHPWVLGRLTTRGLGRTDQQGALALVWDGQKAQLRTYLTGPWPALRQRPAKVPVSAWTRLKRQGWKPESAD